jgi:hypothetical protein
LVTEDQVPNTTPAYDEEDEEDEEDEYDDFSSGCYVSTSDDIGTTTDSPAARAATAGMLVPVSIPNNVSGVMDEGEGVGLMAGAVTGCVRAIAGHT